jgi:hypothetical protein
MATTNPRIAFVLSSDRAALPALNGKRILVHLVVNVEHRQFDQPVPAHDRDAAARARNGPGRAEFLLG